MGFKLRLDRASASPKKIIVGFRKSVVKHGGFHMATAVARKKMSTSWKAISFEMANTPPQDGIYRVRVFMFRFWNVNIVDKNYQQHFPFRRLRNSLLLSTAYSATRVQYGSMFCSSNGEHRVATSAANWIVEDSTATQKLTKIINRSIKGSSCHVPQLKLWQQSIGSHIENERNWLHSKQCILCCCWHG